MRLIRIGLASVDPTVGAVTSNARRVLDLARRMSEADVAIACFPEQVIGGYPPEDLIQWRAFVAMQRRAVEQFASAMRESPVVFVVGLAVAIGGQLFNAAAVVHRGAILGLVPKEKLPTYNVFYEARTFSRGSPGLALDAAGVPLGDYIFAFEDWMLAVDVCEDVWTPDGPMRRRCYAGAEVAVNLSASPFRLGIVSTRREMLATRSADNQTVLAYVNAVGAQDGLVFDGGGYVFQNGRPLLDAPRFREGFAMCTVDLDQTQRRRMENTTWRTDCELFQRAGSPVRVIRATGPTANRSALRYVPPVGGNFFLPPADATARPPRDELLDDLFEALALGVRDYYEKSGAFRCMAVALSGGRDSLLSLLVAWHALGGELPAHQARSPDVSRSLFAFYMPSRYSGQATREAAAAICRDLGITLRELSIDDAFDREIEATRAMLGGAEPDAITTQNIQARLRALRMWDWANTAGALWLQTSDMSEKAVGYTTIGGDLEGGLSVIANVPKTVVIALLERLHARSGFDGIRRTLQTTPSPELAAAQRAEDELMPFPILDACLHLYAADKLAPHEVAAALGVLFPQETPARLRAWADDFARRFTRSIYKWVQSPLAIHVGSLDLDRERALQLPVIERNEWYAIDESSPSSPAAGD